MIALLSRQLARRIAAGWIPTRMGVYRSQSSRSRLVTSRNGPLRVTASERNTPLQFAAVSELGYRQFSRSSFGGRSQTAERIASKRVKTCWTLADRPHV